MKKRTRVSVLLAAVVLLCGICSPALAVSFRLSCGLVDEEDYDLIREGKQTDLRLFASFSDLVVDGYESAALTSFEFILGGQSVGTMTDDYSMLVLPYETWKDLMVYRAEDDSWNLELEVKYVITYSPSGFTDGSSLHASYSWGPNEAWPVPADGDAQGENINVYPQYEAVQTVEAECLSKDEARAFLNFIFGADAVRRTFLIFGHAPRPEVRDYWDLLTGNTGAMSEEKIREVKARLIIETEANLMMKLNGVLTQEQRNSRLNAMRRFIEDKLGASYSWDDCLKDIQDAIVDNNQVISDFADIGEEPSVYVLLDPELWNIVIGSGSLVYDKKVIYTARQMKFLLFPDPYDDEEIYFNAATTGTLNSFFSEKTAKKIAAVIKGYMADVGY